MQYVILSPDGTKVELVFGGPQAVTSDKPGYAAIEDTDARYLAFVAPTPTLVQQAQAMLAAGIEIVSTSTPSINGTYAWDPAARATIAEVVAGINAGDGFPGGGSSFVYPLPGGATFPSTAVFMAFAKAMRDFIYAVSTVAATNAGTLPTLPVTIA